MQPDLARLAFGIVVEPQVFRPFLVADGARRLGPRLRLADIVELGLVAWTAEGTGEDLHGKSLSARLRRSLLQAIPAARRQFRGRRQCLNTALSPSAWRAGQDAKRR